MKHNKLLSILLTMLMVTIIFGNVDIIKAQDPIVIEQQTNYTNELNMGTPTTIHTVTQGFKTDKTQVSKIEIYIHSFGGGTVTAGIGYVTTLLPYWTWLGVETKTSLTNGWNTFYFADATVTPGNQYYIKICYQGTSHLKIGWINGNPYNKGNLWDNAAGDRDNDDLAFKIWGYDEDQIENSPPVISNPNPSNGATNRNFPKETLSVYVHDPDGDLIETQFYGAKQGSSPSFIGYCTVTGSGTSSLTWSDLEPSTTYIWYTHSYDTGSDTFTRYPSTSNTYFSFTTRDVAKYSLTVNVNPPAGGYVHIDYSEVEEDIEESKTFTDIPHGTTIELTACENEDWEFDKWTDDHTGSDDSVTIIMDKDKTITANFKQAGGSPQISFSPSNYDFGKIAVGDCSSTKSFILMNEGGSIATGTVSIAGEQSGQFQITEGDGSFSLSQGTSKTVKVRFCPNSAGSKSATLKATGTNCDSTSSPLSGEGLSDQPDDPTIDFSFVHITDLHMKSTDTKIIWKWLYALYSITNLNPDFIVFTGDIVDNGIDAKAFDAFKDPYNYLPDDWKKRAGSIGDLFNYNLTGSHGKFYVKGILLYCCPGNHDSHWNNDGNFKYYLEKIGPYYYKKSVDGCPVDIFSLTSGTNLFSTTYPRGDGISNRYDDEVTKFKNDLSSSNADYKIVIMHHPYIPFVDNICDGIFYYYNQHVHPGADENEPGETYTGTFGDWCGNKNVNLVLSGHLHFSQGPSDKNGNSIGSTTQHNSITIPSNANTAYVTTPSIGGEGTNYNNFNYRIIDVYKTGEIDIHYAEAVGVPKINLRNNPFLNFLQYHPRAFQLLRFLSNLPSFNKLSFLN